jgi:ABC-type uncharacterized transport system permease subunit
VLPLKDYLVSPASADISFYFSLQSSWLHAQFFLFEALSLLSFGSRTRMNSFYVRDHGSDHRAIIPLSFSGTFEDIPGITLPFLIYFPEDLSRKISAHAVMPTTCTNGWIVDLALVNAAIWKRGLRRYVSWGLKELECT